MNIELRRARRCWNIERIFQGDIKEYLPPAVLNIFLLLLIENRYETRYKYKKIASILDIDPDTVKTQVATHLTKMLRRKLEEGYCWRCEDCRFYSDQCDSCKEKTNDEKEQCGQKFQKYNIVKSISALKEITFMKEQTEWDWLLRKTEFDLGNSIQISKSELRSVDDYALPDRHNKELIPADYKGHVAVFGIPIKLNFIFPYPEVLLLVKTPNNRIGFFHNDLKEKKSEVTIRMQPLAFRSLGKYEFIIINTNTEIVSNYLEGNTLAFVELNDISEICNFVEDNSDVKCFSTQLFFPFAFTSDSGVEIHIPENSMMTIDNVTIEE